MQLNEIEKKYFDNSDAIIAKNSILKKFSELFEEIQLNQKSIVNKYSTNLPAGIPTDFGRVFRGENYNHLPYVVLEYPKYYKHNDVFTFRTMFWWNNFISSTFHVSGNFLNANKTKIFEYLKHTSDQDIYFCVNSTPWEYHYRSDNYLPLSSIKLEDHYNRDFIKISKKFSIHDYNLINELSSEFLEFCLKINYE